MNPIVWGQDKITLNPHIQDANFTWRWILIALCGETKMRPLWWQAWHSWSVEGAKRDKDEETNSKRSKAGSPNPHSPRPGVRRRDGDERPHKQQALIPVKEEYAQWCKSHLRWNQCTQNGCRRHQHAAPASASSSVRKQLHTDTAWSTAARCGRILSNPEWSLVDRCLTHRWP